MKKLTELNNLPTNMSKGNKMKNLIKPNSKIRILSEDHSEYVQKVAFEEGYMWSFGEEQGIKDGYTYLWFTDFNRITWMETEDDYQSCWELEEIFVDLPTDSEQQTEKHSHYFKDVSDLDEVDVYRVCDLFKVNDPSGAIHHAIKKLLCSGKRGAKGYRKDLEEARDTIIRKLELMKEDGSAL